MRRGSSGSADEVCVIPASLRARVGLADGDGCGVTVGNRPDRPCGVIVVPDSGTSVDGGSGGTGVGVGDRPPCPGWPTTVATAASAGEGDAPIEQVFPWLTGHKVNRGARMACALDAALALTRRAATVLQTQIEKVTL